MYAFKKATWIRWMVRVHAQLPRFGTSQGRPIGTVTARVVSVDGPNGMTDTSRTRMERAPNASELNRAMTETGSQDEVPIHPCEDGVGHVVGDGWLLQKHSILVDLAANLSAMWLVLWVRCLIALEVSVARRWSLECGVWPAHDGSRALIRYCGNRALCQDGLGSLSS